MADVFRVEPHVIQFDDRAVPIQRVEPTDRAIDLDHEHTMLVDVVRRNGQLLAPLQDPRFGIVPVTTLGHESTFCMGLQVVAFL